MPTPTLTLPPFSGTIADAITHRVYVRSVWSDPWTEMDNLRCERIVWSAAPGIGTGMFRWRFGRAMAWDTPAWQTVAKLSLNPRGFVRVTAEGQSLPGVTKNTRDWVGTWNSCVDHDMVQRFTADSIEILLSYVTIRTAWYLDGSYNLRQDGSGMVFNAKGQPNRSTVKQPVAGTDVYVFDTNPTRATWWTSRDIVQYLLAAHPPTDATGTALFLWQVENEDALPNFDRPTLETHGRTVWDVLTSVIDRRRSISFYVELRDVPDTEPVLTVAKVNVFTFVESDITVNAYSEGDLGTIPKNADQWSIVASYAQSARIVIGVMATHVADRVRVTGGARMSVCTLSFEDGTLLRGWTDADKTRYEVGASNELDYPSFDEPRARKQRDADARAADDLAHVYQRFTLDPIWDQTCNNGENVGQDSPLAIDDEDQQFFISESSLQIEKYLPFLTGYEYNGSVLANNEGFSGHRGNKVSDGPWLERTPLVILKSEQHSYHLVDRIGVGAVEEIEWLNDGAINRFPIDRSWSAHVRIDSASNAITLNIVGAHPHVIAKNDYAPTRVLDGWPAGGPYEEDSYIGAWDLQTMIATVAIRDSRRCEVVYPETVEPLGSFVNELVIEAGDSYKQIYVVPGTVVDVSPNNFGLYRSDGGYLQDDRDALMAIARRAYEWYSRPRFSLGLQTGWFQGDVWIGSLVISVVDTNSTTQILAPITEITLDFPFGKRAPSVSYATSFAELDPVKMV